jgi:DNA-binding GntR family transcriptional regulator
MARAKVAAPLRQEVAQELKADLANLVYAPGIRLIERELCERYEVSRTIIREVLRELEAEGLVNNIPNIYPDTGGGGANLRDPRNPRGIGNEEIR